MKAITTTLVAIVIGSITALALTPAEAPAAPAEVSKLTPYHACEVTYINYPRRHWCDRKGHVHWL